MTMSELSIEPLSGTPAFAKALALLVFSCVLSASAAFAAPFDEGMWTFDNPPLDRLKNDHGFIAGQDWFDHLRQSSVRFNDGGSGSFISPEGLVLTNHHVGFGAIQKLSSEGKDYVKNGFYAPTRDAELACPDAELNVLVSIEDVTAKISGAVASGATPKEANDQRRAAIARLEKEEAEKTGLRCNVIPLYQGGEYALYRFKKYTDVRLVFAPEEQIAFFGGDPDNFNFPRHDLDMAIFRVYEDGKPAATPHYLRWSVEGPKEGDLVFVSGHPGSTERLKTMAQLEYQRDVAYPTQLKSFERRLALLESFSKRSEESARRAKSALRSVENSLKARRGEFQGLSDARLMARKSDEEKKLREFVAKDPALAQEALAAWDDIARAREKAKGLFRRTTYTSFRGSRLLAIAGQVVRLTAELEKPNEDRLEEYGDSKLESLKHSLFSSAPIYSDLEETTLADAFAEALEALGPADPYVAAALQGKTPEAAAAAAVSGTKLGDPAVRRALVEGGRKAVEASDDPMIALARRIDPISRELRKITEDEIESVETQAGDRIARARFKAYGRSVYPDATFTLRLAYGTVKGYTTASGYAVPPFTTFHGLFERSAAFGNKGPFEVPQRWIERKSSIRHEVPFNFACTADIIGGNSGSPAVNARGELVGLIFDGNIESLVSRFIYDDAVGRAVCVHSAGMLEAMKGIYRAEALVREILQATDPR